MARIVCDAASVKSKCVARFWEIAPQLGEVIRADCNVYCREQTGRLIRSSRVTPGGRRITWNTAYAKRVYYTGTPRHNVNPNASLRWCEKAKIANAQKWGETATRLVNS